MGELYFMDRRKALTDTQALTLKAFSIDFRHFLQDALRNGPIGAVVFVDCHHARSHTLAMYTPQNYGHLGVVITTKEPVGVEQDQLVLPMAFEQRARTS